MSAKLRYLVGIGLLLGLVQTAGAQAPAGAEPSKPWWEKAKFSGLMFGDAAYFASDHDPAFDGESAFWIRRLYLTYDQQLTDEWSTRIRFEANHPGDFKASQRLDAYVKDAYVQWARGATKVQIGLAPAPTWELAETLWGYRPVEKTIIDLYRLGGPRDTGVSVRGDLAANGKVKYVAMLANGSEVGSETNDGKKVMAALQFYPTSHLTFELYGDFDDRPGQTDRTTFQGLAVYKTDRGRLGLQYVQQKRELAAGDLKLDVASLWGAWRLNTRLALLARVDRSFDANPDGAKIGYLPFDPGAKFWFYLAGVEYTVNKHVSFIPNVELVSYSKRPDGTTVDDDVVPRITLDLRF